MSLSVANDGEKADALRVQYTTSPGDKDIDSADGGGVPDAKTPIEG